MAEDSPVFSLVFLTWNAEEVIENTLSAALNQDYTSFEVVVVDNDSDDATIQQIRDVFGNEQKIRIVQNNANLGFSQGINQGIAASAGDYICCYNHDTLLPEEYLSTLQRSITDDAVWTTARINHRVTDSQKCVRLLGRTGFTIPYAVDDLTGTLPVNFVPGDGVIVPRRVFTEVLNEQIFNPELPPRGEDVALSLKLRSSGVPLRAVVDTHSIHPDKGDRYAPTLKNLEEFLLTYRARLLAHRMYDSSVRTLILTLLSIVTQPLSIYFGSFPKSERKFREGFPKQQ